MRDWKNAFGSPDEEFAERVGQTLLRIRKKEEEPVKRKLTLSAGLAFVLALTVLAVTAFAAGGLLKDTKPDLTQPLARTERGNPGAAEGTAAPSEETPLPAENAADPAPLPAEDDGRVAASPTPTPTPMPMAIAQPTPLPVASEVVYYYMVDPEFGEYYHITTHGMDNNTFEVTPDEIRRKALAPCPLCMAQSVVPFPTVEPEPEELFYHTEYGTYYHVFRNCQGMKNAVPVTEADALAMGQKPCPLCVGEGADGADTTAGAPEPAVMPVSTLEPGSEYPPYYYIGDDPEWAEYYHISSHGNTADVFEVSPQEIRRQALTTCPLCLAQRIVPFPTVQPEPEVYYRVPEGKYYHAFRRCSGMTDATPATEAEALAEGLWPCPKCVENRANADWGGPMEDRDALYASGIGLMAESLHIRDTTRVTELWSVETVSANGRPMSTPEYTVESCPKMEGDVTIHRICALRARGGLFVEAEFELKTSVDPMAIRLVPVAGEQDWPALVSAVVKPVRYDDGTTGYLLSEMFDAPDWTFAADRLRVYVEDEHKMGELLEEYPLD